MSDDEDSGDSRNISTPEAANNYQPVSEADREMASIALQEFEEEKFEESLIILKKLQSKRPQDLKVRHNICVVEYYLSNFKDTEIFRQKNLDICKQAHIKMEGMEALDDVDNCVLLYNQAVVLFHLHQYNAAIQVIEKVVQYIEPLDETLGKHVSLLLCDIYLNVHQPKRLQNLTAYMETNFSSNRSSAKGNAKDEQREDSIESIVSEQAKRRYQFTKARLYATLKTSKACKREIKNLMSSGSATQNIPVFYLKSQLEYQRGNYRKAVKIINTATLPKDFVQHFHETGDCLPVTFFNNIGCIHFYMGKANLGKFYTRRAITEFENLMCATSNQEHDPINVLNSRPLHLLSISTRHQLVYNLGLQSVQLQKFDDAFICFMEVIRSYYANPRLWLRIAECCIHIHRPNGVDQYVEYAKKPVIKTVLGAGPYRKLILNSSIVDKVDEMKHMDIKDITPSLQFAMICLKNARILLPEHYSVPSVVFHASKSSCQEDNSVYVSDENHHLSVLPSTYISGSEIGSLRNSILVASSYVSLCLGDVIQAHEYAKLLLSQPRVSAAQKFLAHLYAGESLLLMDRITEAVEHFTFQQDNDIELAFPASSSEVSLKHQMRFDSKLSEKNDDGSRPVGNIPNWFPNIISSARFVSLYNLAVAYAVREEWTKALECLQQMNPNGEVPNQAYPLLIYVQLQQGNADDIKTYLKQSLISGYS